ncbi:DUF58 domain-containing protein [Roseibacillus ishigakijimensis]|uniref:DUF58 domain-containing protein n=1 Tax=Roseibacillus ishigakijimensis TaxID=454146 RepID=A0A934RL58_9BACT|nr:DUF58 domain-containing protein [Roseibacillus ishigakijimensis]MBK1832868.1 DUF58 domain-containing protein [Roseibacillus ishigakijimensis]
MRPSFQLLGVSALLFVFALAVVFWPGATIFFSLALVLFLFVALLDAILLGMIGKVSLVRKWPTRFALKEETEVSYEVHNEGRLPVRLRFFEGLPPESSYSHLPFDLPRLKPGEKARASYRVAFLQRGDLPVEPAYLELRSLLGLWWRSRRVGEGLTARVYPNYVPALNYGLLATADRAELMGIVKPRRRGMSKEFHQLRDYHEGDSLSQVDWKATARANRLITREYQEERDQTILLVPDCSLRTRAIDGDLPILDHLLNAAILLSYIALGQGDKVGVMSFGGADRYLSPVKGNSGMARILDHLYNYQPTRDYSDYNELVARILRTQHKRCLIVLLTNLRSEDQFGSLGALQLLSRQHLVMLASVRETVVESALRSPLASSADADRYLGALAYEDDVARLVSEARGLGFSAIHESLEHYPIALANQFLDLRASGRF